MIKGILLMLLGISILALFAWVITFLVSVDRYSAKTKAGWPTVPGTVTHSTAIENSPNDEAPSVMAGFSDQNWTVTVSFEYMVNGSPYASFQMWAANQSDAQSQKNKYSSGTVVPVHYKPDQPSTSVVEPGEEYYNSTDRIIVPLVAGGAGLFWAGAALYYGVLYLRESTQFRRTSGFFRR